MDKTTLEKIDHILWKLSIKIDISPEDLKLLQDLATYAKEALAEEEYQHQIYLDSVPPDFGTYD